MEFSNWLYPLLVFIVALSFVPLVFSTRRMLVSRLYVVMLIVALPLVMVSAGTALFEYADCMGSNVPFRCEKAVYEPFILLLKFGDTYGFAGLMYMFVSFIATAIVFIAFLGVLLVGKKKER